MNQSKTIYWLPQELKYPSIKKTGNKWLIFTQMTIKIKANSGKMLSLGFGFKQSEGIVLTSLSKDLETNLIIFNNIFPEASYDNINIFLWNFSQQELLIPENTPLCFIQYLKS